MKTLQIILLYSIVVILPSSARSATVTLTPAKDNTIYQSNTSASAGGAPGVFVGSNGQGSPRRGLIAFDIAASIPAGSTITGAELRMYLANAPTATAYSLGLHKLTRNWGEGTAGSTVLSASGGGNGFAAAAGDATWNEAHMGSIAWTNPGAVGDFNTTASGSASVTGPIDSAFTWSSTAALVTDVQSWLNAPATNFGWALVNASESTNQSVKVFYSRSATQNSSGAALDLSWRPTLTVTFVPEPTIFVLFVSALPFAIFTRQR